MIIIGAGGLAKQILDVVERLECSEEIFFYDNVSVYNENPRLYKYSIIQNVSQLYEYSKKEHTFLVLGVGKPNVRKTLYNFFIAKDFKFRKIRACTSLVGNHDVEIGEGTVIMENVIIESSVKIGKGVLLNTGTKVFHDSCIGDFCELAPNSIISPSCIIGNEVYIGTNTVIMQGVEIGDGVVIGSGQIVTENVFKF